MKHASPRLSAHGLVVKAGARTLVRDLDLDLVPGEVVGVLGPNGAGKSTLLAVLAGLARPSSGNLLLGPAPLAAMQPLTRAQHIGFLPQGDETGFFGSVRDFVALGRFPFADAPVDIDTVLARWELDALAARALDTLSGGERQRARLAQLAMQASRVALLDEPLTHLDPAHQARLLAWARDEAAAGRSMVLTLHDPNWAAGHCDRLLFLYGDGRWQLGRTDELLEPNALGALYGADSAALWRRPGAQLPV